MENHELAGACVSSVKENSSKYCSICLSDDIGGGESYRKLGECGHSFHSRCIDVWLRSHSTCPLCRAQLPQIISLTLNQTQYYDWNHFVSTLMHLLNDFMHKMCNPLNDELSSMLCGNIK